MPPASLCVIKLMHALGSWAVLSALYPHHQIYTSLSYSFSATSAWVCKPVGVGVQNIEVHGVRVDIESFPLPPDFALF